MMSSPSWITASPSHLGRDHRTARRRLPEARPGKAGSHLGIFQTANLGKITPAATLADLLLVERRLGREVEPVEIAHERKARQLDAHLDPALVLAGDLALAEQRERLADRQLAPSGLVDQAVELVADCG